MDSRERAQSGTTMSRMRGWSIRGTGEKFSTNLVTGTGSVTAPIAIPPGRSGFDRQLSFPTISHSRDGLSGLGWNMSLRAITRKTDDQPNAGIAAGAPQLVDLAN